MRNTIALSRYVWPVLAATACTTTAYAQVLLADHFDTAPGSATPWVNIKGNQWITDGWLNNQHTDPPFVNGRSACTAAHADDTSWTDYSFSLRVNPIPTQAFSGEYWARAGVLFRVSNLGWEFYDYGPSGTFYRLDIAGTGDVETPHLELYHKINGVYTMLASRAGWTPPAAPFDVYITASGSHITVSIAGEKVFDVQDPGGPAFGGVAVHNIWESRAAYDDVVVGVLPAQTCPADFNGDGFVDFTDFDAFVEAFEAGC